MKKYKKEFQAILMNTDIKPDKSWKVERKERQQSRLELLEEKKKINSEELHQNNEYHTWLENLYTFFGITKEDK